MENHFEITPKGTRQLEVLVNLPNQTMSFNKKTIRLQSKHFSTPSKKLEGGWEINIIYGLLGEEKRRRDIEEIKRVSSVDVKPKRSFYEDPPANFLYLHFPQNTKISITN